MRVIIFERIVFVTLKHRRNSMKKMLFALALLVPALASAAVEMNVKMRFGADATEKTFTFTEKEMEHGIKHDSGVDTKFVLVAETAEKASFEVVMTKDETVLDKSLIEVEYNKEASFKCPAENVDAEIVVMVQSLTVVNQ